MATATWIEKLNVDDYRRKDFLMHKSLFVLGSLAAFALAPLVPIRADEAATQLQSLLAKRSPAIVTVKLVLKTQFKSGGQGQDSESRLELQGVAVDPAGLIMVSSSAWSPERWMQMMGRDDSSSVKVTPTDIKIVFENDEKEYGAFLAATDTKLDLSFIKIEDKLDHPVTAVDFSNAAAPAVGEEVVSVSRLSKGYDYAPFFDSARVSGLITKPRKAWMLDGGLSGFGLPVFTAKDGVVGVLTTVPSGVNDPSSQESMGFAMAMRLMTGGHGLVSAFIVPGQAVEAVIAQAKKRAVEVGAQRAKDRASGAATPASAKKAPAKPQEKSK
jgi:hypothetical protein